jgi:capsular polysaccharide biosynthesis protein
MRDVQPSPFLAASVPLAASAAGNPELPTGPSLDPHRLLGALRLRRSWIIRGALIGAVLGLVFGIFRAQTRWEVTVQLIKRDTPTSFSIGTDGNPYRPREFTVATLVTAATSHTVLERVAAKSKPPVSADLLRYCVKVEEEKKTDFLTLTVSGYNSAQATADLANLWAQEVVNFPKDVQAAESREIREALNAQLVRNQTELKRLDQQSLEVPREEVQLDTYLHSQGDIELKIDSTRIEVESLDSEIATLRSQLILQSPLADTLREAKSDLEQAMARYTEENPLVIEKRQKIASIEKQMADDTKAAQSDLSKFAGTEVGNHLYMRIVELENQSEALKRQNEELSKLRAKSLSTSDQEFGLPDILRQKETLETAQTLLLNRLQEMSLFEQNAQEMYLVLAPATVDQVTAKGKPFKVTIYSIAALILGAGIAAGLVLLFEVLDSRLRTSGEAAKLTGVPIFASIPRYCAPDLKPEIAARLWLRWNRDRGRDRAGRAIWAPVQDAYEDDFWNLILDEARRFASSLLIVDCGKLPSDALAALPRPGEGAHGAVIFGERWNVEDFDHVRMSEALDAIEKHRKAGREVWLRFDGAVQEPDSTLARAVGSHPLVLIALDTESAAFWRDQVELLRESVGNLSGVVLLNELPVFAS